MDENVEQSSPQQPASFRRNDNSGSSFFSNIKSYFNRTTVSVLVLLVLVIGIGATIIATQQSTETRQRASAPTAPVPGTCLILPQKFCATGKPVLDASRKFQGIGFTLPANTPVFAFGKGIVGFEYINIDKNTLRGFSISPVKQVSAVSFNVNTYFKNSSTSGINVISKKVEKGAILGHIQKDPQNQYDLLVNFSKLGNNTITIDKQLTLKNFGL